MLADLVRFIQHKLHGRKSEIRLGLVVKPFSQLMRSKLLNKVKKLAQT